MPLINCFTIILTINFSTYPSQALENDLSDILSDKKTKNSYQNSEIHKRFREGNHLFQAGEFKEALEVYELALNLLDGTNSSMLIVGKIFHNAAISARILGQIGMADIYIDQALDIA